jgi:hypothetical protein
MSFIALYAENASVVGSYHERALAVRAAVTIAMRQPDLSPEIGIAELDDGDGHVIAPFVSASDLLATDDADAVAAADAYSSAAQDPQGDVVVIRQARGKGTKTTIKVVTDDETASALEDVPPGELSPMTLEPGESVTIADGAVTVTRGVSSGALK